MTKKSKSLLFINSIGMIDIDGYESFPTALYLDKDQTFFGNRAISESQNLICINENFKVALGEINPGRSVYSRKTFTTAGGEEKTAYELTKIFLEKSLDHAQKQIKVFGSNKAESILVSEPVAFQDHNNPEGWIANYRSNLRRVLGQRFKDVEFLPEPFAVFQYYRYGLRHPSVSEKKKYFALVVDFGGGTFDISILETTREGDISQRGRHSKPLASTSVPVGGFIINQELASEIIISVTEKNDKKAEIRKQINNYNRWKAGGLELDSLAKRNQYFIRAFEELTRKVETKKIQLTRLIREWDLDRNVGGAISIDVPTNPFEESPSFTSFRLTAAKYRDVFIHNIWNSCLKKAVKSALNIATQELQGKPINVFLISGGSANIRWLEKLLIRDFSEQLQDSTPVRLSEDFQHIVSKGLAVECARREHDPDSEFVTVTYNPVYVLLSPDGQGIEIKKFKPVSDGLPNLDEDGMLLPSATALREFIGKTLRWKVKLSHPPKRRLDYFFMRSTLDHHEYSKRYNVENVVHTKPRTKFDSQISLELEVSRDGTINPRFIYKKGRDGGPEDFVDGSPFVIDMTTGSETSSPLAYVGYDFGSSNSSISYVSQGAINTYEERKSKESWLNLNELVEQLPWPVSRPLSEFLSYTGNIDREANQLITAIESSMHFSGTIAYSIARSVSGERNTKILKSFMLAKRSLGPLYRFLQDSLTAAPTGSEIIAQLKRLSEDKFPDLKNSIDRLNNFKHGKLDAQDVLTERESLEKILNILKDALDGWRFGYFQSVESKPFCDEYKGIFRVANVTRPFYEVVEYVGKHSFSQERAYLIDIEDGVAIDLSPLFFWLPNSNGNSNADRCLMFDKEEANPDTITFTNIGEKSCTEFSEGESYYDGIKDELEFHRKRDPYIQLKKDLRFTTREDR